MDLIYKIQYDHTTLQLFAALLELVKFEEAGVDASNSCRTGPNFGLAHVGVTDRDKTFDLTVSG